MIVHQFDLSLPFEQAATIPADWYFNPAVYAAECRQVFGQSWLALERSSLVATPGQYCTTEIAGEPMLAVRDQARELRAFFNVCRHRGARVLTEPSGEASRLRCPYHGWTYDLAGQLRGVPEFEGVEGFCREENGLVPVRVDNWGPMIWVNMDGAAPPLAEYLAPLPERLAGLGIDALAFIERREYDLACNWKVFVDNYLDGGYHVNTIHPGLAGVLDYREYKTEILGNAVAQISPLRTPDPGRDDVSAARVRIGAQAQYWWVYPNFMLNVYEGVMDTNVVLPLGPERCRVIMDWYFPPNENGEAMQRREESIAVSHKIQLEDIAICADVQRGMRSRSYERGRYSVKREAGVFHFHQMMARQLGGS